MILVGFGRVQGALAVGYRLSMDDDQSELVYRPPGWSDVADLFCELRFDERRPVEQWLDDRASLLFNGWRQGHPAVASILSNWHPDLIGRPEQVAGHRLTIEDARIAAARELGFQNWAEVASKGSRVMDPEFEAAVDAILAGDAESLVGRIEAKPGLVVERSAFAHRATLLHYLGSNGLETERQVVPRNGATLIRLLLEAGADVGATMLVYGGAFTTIELIETSSHPWAAGVGATMVEALGGVS